MTRPLALCTIAVMLCSTGCASAKSGAAPDTAPPVTMTQMTQRVVMAGEGALNINTSTVNAGSTQLIVTSLDSAWTALQAAYTEFGLPVSTLVEATHLIGNEGFKTRRRIGKIPMQKVVDCGNSLGMPNAETYDIVMVVSSYLAKNPKGGVNLVTRIDASGKSPNFSRGASVVCRSLGELEKQIGELVRKKTGS